MTDHQKKKSELVSKPKQNILLSRLGTTLNLHVPDLVRKVGPRGVDGVFGWTFFDPGNLVSLGLLMASMVLVVISMRARGAPDWYMPLGLYLCICAFLRGYFFNYYHGKMVERVTVLIVLVGSILYSAALWEDRATGHEVLRQHGVYHVPPAHGFHVAALLHVTCAIALIVHNMLPRHWLMRATDGLAERTGRENLPDAPLETITDPRERVLRMLESSAQDKAKRERAEARQRRDQRKAKKPKGRARSNGDDLS